MLGIVCGLIVMVRDSDGGVGDRVVIEPVLPEGSALQPVAVPRLIGVPDDRARLATIDPLGDVEERVRRAVEGEGPSPAAGFTLRRAAVPRRVPDDRAAVDAAVATSRQDEARGMTRLSRQRSASGSDERQARVRGIAAGPDRRQRVGHAIDTRAPLDEVLAMHVLRPDAVAGLVRVEIRPKSLTCG